MGHQNISAAPKVFSRSLFTFCMVALLLCLNLLSSSSASNEGKSRLANRKLSLPAPLILNSGSPSSRRFASLNSRLLPTFGICGDVSPVGSNIEVEAANFANNKGYSTLHEAFDAINVGTHTGAITIDVCGNTSEGTATARLDDNGTDPIIIKPVGQRTISGATTAGLPLIDFNGADRVTIDGLNDLSNALTISNLTTAATAGTSTIRFSDDATDNKVTNCSILGSSTSIHSTPAATIIFGTGTITGNDNNVISNNRIGPAGSTLPSRAIMGTGTSTVINDKVQITGNRIFDFFLPGGRLSVIYVVGGNDDWIISNNRFYQTAPRTFTAAKARYAAITLNDQQGSLTISDNVIGFGTADGTGVTTITGGANEFRGIDAIQSSVTVPTSIQGNTISGINQTTSNKGNTAQPFIAISMGVPGQANPEGLFNVTGNTVGSLDGTSGIVFNSTVIAAANASISGISNVTRAISNVSNNEIGAITIQGLGVGVGFNGIHVENLAGIHTTIDHNTVGGPGNGAISDTLAGSYSMYGIVALNNQAFVTRNTVRNMNSNSLSAALVGIHYFGKTENNVISRNVVHSLSNAGGGSVFGVRMGFFNRGHQVEGNFVHSLSLTASLATSNLIGIDAVLDVNGAAVYSNNMVRLGIDAAGQSIMLGIPIIGIRVTGRGTHNFYHNTVYIGGSGVISSSDTFAFSSNIADDLRVYRNNIFVNKRTGTGAGFHVAYNPAGTTPGVLNLRGNGNVYYAPNLNGVEIRNQGNNYNVAQWRAATANNQDLQSFGGIDPLLENPEGTAATVDLHLNHCSPVSICDKNGLMGVPVLDDFDGEERANLTPVDIGADAVDCTTPLLVSLPHLTGPSGSIITVPMTVGNLTGMGVRDYTVQVSFDQAIAVPVAHSVIGTLSSGMNVTSNTAISGHWIISASMMSSSQPDLTGAGTLINLSFQIIGPPGQQTPLTFADYTEPNSAFHPGFRFNAGSPPNITSNGSLHINGPTAAPAQISGHIVTPDGQPVGGATVTVVGGAQERRAITDGNGDYQLRNLEAGGFYIVTPSHANFLFSPVSRAFSIIAARADVVFTGFAVSANKNPLESPEFFVRQQYLDFLGREPEQSGLDYWSSQLRTCGDDEGCIRTRRLDISAAFFTSQEFQDSGTVCV